MASKTAPKTTGQSDFFNIELVFVCSFLGSLFNHFLTKFWTTFGCLFGCLLGAFSGLLRFSWEASGSKNTKKLKVFSRFLIMQLFGSLKLLMALLGSSCPLFGRSGPKMNPKKLSKISQQIVNLWAQFWIFLLGVLELFGLLLGAFLGLLRLSWEAS